MQRKRYSKFLTGLVTSLIIFSLFISTALAAAGDTTRVSVASDSTQGNSNSGNPSVSADGRYVAFYSLASSLVSGDTNGYEDIFVHDRQSGETTLVSVASDGTQGNSVSFHPSISADGRYVAFESSASNLVSGDTNGYEDIFVHDRQSGQTTRVSVSSDGAQGNHKSWASPISHISADGRYVVFYSWASNLVSGDTNGYEDIFVHDRQSGQTTRVSIASDGTQGNNYGSGNPSISADGRYVAFYSLASSLVSGDTNGTVDVFVHDQQSGQTTRVSVASGGAQGNNVSRDPSLSADGRYVAFWSYASNLVSGDTNGKMDIFVHDRQTGQTTRVSIASDGMQGNTDTGYFTISISADGRYVAFYSAASNLVSGDTNNAEDVFVHDRQSAQTTRVSIASDGAQGNSTSEGPSISADGRYVAFQSSASNLVSGDTNGKMDIFVHEMGSGSTTYFVSGLVADNGGNAISGVSISDGAGHITTTDSNGNYILSGLAAGTYTITPSKSGYTFSPASRAVTVPSDATGQDFVMVMSLDIGFHPNSDGYGFSNYVGVNLNDYTISDMRRMFGDEAVCQMVFSVCIPRFSALEWLVIAHYDLNAGHCDGMASTSLRFFKNLDNPVDFQSEASTTHDLLLDNIRQHIAYYFVEQLTDPVRSYKETVRQNTPVAILGQLYSAMSNGASDPTTLFVRQAGEGGHAITPYAIEDKGGGVFWVRVYDNNYIDDANHYVVINTTNNTWSYERSEASTWSGDADTKSLGIVPISQYAELPVCPWCSNNGVGTQGASTSSEVRLTGGGHLLITDSQGQRLGYDGNQLVSEIPGAYASAIDAGVGIELEPIYVLPLTETYTILLDGQVLTQTETTAITQFGPGYAVSVDDILLGPASRDELTFTSDGTDLSYQASEGKRVTLTLALENANESYQFQVKGADIGAGQIVTAAVETSTTQLVLNNAQAGGGEYDLNIRCTNTTGEQSFDHFGVVISATDTHFMDYGCTSGSISLHIDHGSDGTIDETVILENQVRIYLPLVLR
jgi:Tol biopolymer transport system component